MHIAAPAPAFPAAWPRLGMGCAPLGNIFHDWPEDQAMATFAAAWAAGVRYFDTAPWYGHGLSEHRLGAFLRQVPRDQVLISTKVGRVYDPAPRGQDARVQWAGGLNFAVRYDYSGAGFAQALAQSQLRLGQPSVDSLIIHDLDQAYHGDAFAVHSAALEATGYAWLAAQKAAGAISAIGMGINTLAAFQVFAPVAPVDFFLVAMPYTLIDQVALDGPMATCLARGIRVVIGAPFASGLLTDPDAAGVQYNYGPVPDDVRARARAIRDVCNAHGVPLMAAALQFPLLHPAVVSVIPGAVSPAQVQGNAANMAHPIPSTLWADLKERGLIHPDAPVS
jgi:D-threo-aldose 1-dehydrogenase